MGWSHGVRQVHRWTSITFTAIVIALFAAAGLGEPPPWVYFLPLPPLGLLLFTGLWLFARPHVAGWRAGRTGGQGGRGGVGA